jgi:hypothetical protein
MNSAIDLSKTTSLSATTSHQISPRSVYLWIGLALFGLAMVGGVAGSYYMNMIHAPNIIDAYVGP